MMSISIAALLGVADGCSVFLAVRGIQGIQAAGAITANSFFGDAIFRNIVISLIATYGIYILASIFALDPWHMGETHASFGMQRGGLLTQ